MAGLGRRYMLWAASLHGAQLAMFIGALALALFVAAVFLDDALQRHATAEVRVARATNYSRYKLYGEDTLPNADLWEKKTAEGFDALEAIVYVAFRPTEARPDSGRRRLSDSLRTEAVKLRRILTRPLNRSRFAIAGLLIVLGAGVVLAWTAAWSWLGDRRVDKGAA